MAIPIKPITWAWLYRYVEYGSGRLPKVRARTVTKAARRETNPPSQTNKATAPNAAGSAWEKAHAAQLVTSQPVCESRSTPASLRPPAAAANAGNASAAVPGALSL
jgi:hypothetical protein